MKNNRTTSHRKITTYRLSPEMNTRTQAALEQQTNNLPLQGHWGKRDAAVNMVLNVHRNHKGRRGLWR